MTATAVRTTLRISISLKSSTPYGWTVSRSCKAYSLA